MRPHQIVRLLLPVALFALPAGAQFQRVTFSDLTQPLTNRNIDAAIGAPLRRGGFDFYNDANFAPAGTSANNAFTVWGTDDPGAINRPRNLDGSNAIFTDGLGSEIDIFAAGADLFGPSALLPTFGLASIDFAHVYSDLYARGQFTIAQTSFQIFGSNSAGATFFQNVLLDVAPPDANGIRTPMLQTVFLDSRFSNVNNVWFNQATGSGRAFQFTNVTPTPEPASMMLMATGLFGVAGVAARRRRKDVAAA